MATRSTPPAATASTPSYLVPFIIVTALFGIFGFLTNLNSNLAKELEDIFQSESRLVQPGHLGVVLCLPGLLGALGQAD